MYNGGATGEAGVAGIMRVEFGYIAEGVTYRAVAEDADKFWGKCIRIRTFDTGGGTRERISFSCHPEFDGFEEMQGKTLEELAAIAIDRLNAGEFAEALESARRTGIELLVRFN